MGVLFASGFRVEAVLVIPAYRQLLLLLLLLVLVLVLLLLALLLLVQFPVCGGCFVSTCVVIF